MAAFALRNPNLSRKLLLVVWLSSCPSFSVGQNPVSQAGAAPPPSFDIVSIKPSKPGATGSSSRSDNDTFSATNSTLKSLIQFDAYEIPGPQIFGIPTMLSNAAFDINAKIDPEVYARMKALNHEQYNLQWKQMMRQLLADSFKLAVHTETRQLPVYALVVAKGGPKLEDAKSPGDGTRRSSGTGHLKAEGVTAADLAQSLTRILANELGRIVVDQTGLAGKYDLTLKWTPDSGPPAMLNGEPDTSAPNIFTAIQEQLGLKLESTKAPVQVLVVDHAELPSEN
jgi:uncharacterized protein (TIGR03435 family)